uniref:ADP ribosylation factor like GTPase 2 n=1 Tax=Oryctolagus cuniculus TaxID=9986 RepID=G1TQP6_RABIT
MGFLTILKKMKQKERELGLLMLGLDNAGKTTILKKFNGEDVDTISPTLGFNIKTLEHRGFKLNIWDVGGQKSLRSYWRNYFESTDVLQCDSRGPGAGLHPQPPLVHPGLQRGDRGEPAVRRGLAAGRHLQPHLHGRLSRCPLPRPTCRTHTPHPRPDRTVCCPGPTRPAAAHPKGRAGAGQAPPLLLRPWASPCAQL